MSNPSRRHFLQGAATVAASAFSYSATAQTQSPSVQDKLDKLQRLAPAERQNFLRAEAEKEGAVVMYAADSPDLIRAWQAGFRSDYPKIDAQFIRTTSADMLVRAVNESKLGKPVADILHPPAVQLAVLERANLLAKYVSPEAKAIPAALSEPSGLWTTYWIAPSVIAFNKELIKKEDVPVTLEQLASSKLGNRMGRNSLGSRWVAGVFQAVGEAAGTDFIKRIAAQRPRLYDSNLALLSALASGQVVVGFDINMSDVIVQQKKGAPLEYIIADPLIVLPVYQVIMKDAPHPYAAALAADWILSKRGQSAYHDLGQLGTRSDVEYEGAAALKGSAKPPIYLSAQLLAEPERFNKIFEDLFIRRLQ